MMQAIVQGNKQKPSGMERLLPNGCMGNPLSSDEPRSIISVDGASPHASLFKR